MADNGSLSIGYTAWFAAMTSKTSTTSRVALSEPGVAIVARTNGGQWLTLCRDVALLAQLSVIAP
jgi:hypothetical protein